MFKQNVIFISALMVSILVGFTSCQKEKITAASPGALPKIETMENTVVSSVSAKSGCIVRTEGRGKLIVAGLCWANHAAPTLEDSFNKLTTSQGAYTCTIGDLTAGTTYYTRAYATNELGTSYGQELSFTTLPSWKEVTNAQLVINSYGSIAASGNYVFIHDLANRVYRSSDEGDTWELFNNGLSNMTGVGLMSVIQASVIIVETNGRAFASDINSDNWSQIADPMTGVEANETITSVNLKNDKLIITKPYSNVYEVTINDNSAYWLRIYAFHFYATQVNHIITKGDKLFAGSSNYSRIYKSDDVFSWSDPTGGKFPNISVSALAVNGEDIYAATSNGVYLSSNDGKEWTQTDPNTAQSEFKSFVFGGNYIIATTNSGIKMSTNKGAGWIPFQDGLPGTYSGLVAGNNYFYTIANKSASFKLYRRRFN